MFHAPSGENGGICPFSDCGSYKMPTALNTDVGATLYWNRMLSSILLPWSCDLKKPTADTLPNVELNYYIAQSTPVRLGP